MAIATKLSELVALRSGLIQQINHDYGANLSSDSTLTDCLVAMLRTKAVVYDFTSLTALPENYTLTRNSIATYFNSSGVLTTAAVDEARFNYSWDGSNWVNEGLYVEKESTNIISNSYDFSNYGSVSATVKSRNDIKNIFNSTPSYEVSRTNYKTWHGIYTYPSSPFAQGDFVVNQTIYDVANSSSTLIIQGFWQPGDGFLKVDLVNKKLSGVEGSEVISPSVDQLGTFIKATSIRQISDLGVNTAAPHSQPLRWAGLDYGTDSTIIAFNQCEVFKVSGGYPSSLIKTSGSAATRTRDYLSINSSTDQSVLLKYKSQLDNSIQTTWVDLVAGNNTLSDISGILLQKIIECKQLLTDDQKDWYGSRIL